MPPIPRRSVPFIVAGGLAASAREARGALRKKAETLCGPREGLALEAVWLQAGAGQRAA
jgi:hypothetical protein